MAMGIIGTILIAVLAISIIIATQKENRLRKYEALEQESDLKAARKYIEGLK